MILEEKYRLTSARDCTAAALCLEARGPGARWFGVVGGERGFQRLIGMLMGEMRGGSVMLCQARLRHRAGRSRAPSLAALQM